MVVMYLWMLGLKSEGGVRQGCLWVMCAVLAALSVHSLPGMPTWPGSQRRRISKSDAVSKFSLEF